MSKWVAAAALLLVATGCGFGNEARSCTSNAECNSVEHPGGVCEASTHLCSFPDTSCPDGFRYGGLAGDQSNQCVPGPGQGSNPIADAAIDSPPPIDTAPPIDSPPDAEVCFGTGIVKVCLASAPTGDLASLGGTLDTTNSPQCAQLASGGDFCVIAATTITLQTALRAIGTRPLVLLASDSITTTAIIDVASHRVNGTDEIGAGGDSLLCSAGTAPATLSGTSGGGAGGSFTGGGGNGGAGATLSGSAPGGAGGLPGGANIIVSELRGGCPGQQGAGSSTDAGARGHGGGAIFLLAGSSITVQQTINASGEGGGGGIANVSGGGGGGSGGLIGFDAPTIAVTGVITANGGGGGEGDGNTPGSPGNETTTESAATGGTGAINGGNGGNGSSGAAAGPGSVGATGTLGGGFRGGGGGGGGGAGYVVAPQTASFPHEVSPAPTIQTP